MNGLVACTDIWAVFKILQARATGTFKIVAASLEATSL